MNKISLMKSKKSPIYVNDNDDDDDDNKKYQKDFSNEIKAEHNLKWPYIPDYSYTILIIKGCGSGKTNALSNLVNNHPDIDKICMLLLYLYVNDSYEAKYDFLINKKRTHH